MIFSRLFELAGSTPIGMTISANTAAGTMTVNVTPTQKGEGDEAALRTPLCLTATPEELDAGFVDALTGYTAARKSLAEQVTATVEVLKAAAEATAQKGAKAIRRASAPKGTNATTPQAGTDADEGDGDRAVESSSDGNDATAKPSESAPAEAVAQPAPAPSQPSLFA
jgi:PRTRC genetic system protein E